MVIFWPFSLHFCKTQPQKRLEQSYILTMESAIIQQETLRQVTDVLRHSRSKEGLERRLQEILSENFSSLDKVQEKP